jgi:hypothetical protein
LTGCLLVVGGRNGLVVRLGLVFGWFVMPSYRDSAAVAPEMTQALDSRLPAND